MISTNNQESQAPNSNAQPTGNITPETVQAAKFCTNCGSPISEGQTFCTNCGQKLS